MPDPDGLRHPSSADDTALIAAAFERAAMATDDRVLRSTADAWRNWRALEGFAASA
jgi:hypothetical protein